MTITLIILAIVLSILSGFFKAICDTSEEGVLKFKNTFFGLKIYRGATSGRIRQKQGEKFFGSSRWFCFIYRRLALCLDCFLGYLYCDIHKYRNVGKRVLFLSIWRFSCICDIRHIIPYFLHL